MVFGSTYNPQDPDQPIRDLDLPYQKLKDSPGLQVLELCELLGKLDKVHPLDHRIVWKYDPLRETTVGPNNNVHEVHRNRMEGILGALAEKYRVLKESNPEAAGEISLYAGNYSSF